jgi:hypothetical protein
MNGLDKNEKVAPLDNGATSVIAMQTEVRGRRLAVISWQREEETALIERTKQERLSH